MKADYFSDDIQEFLLLLDEYKVRYVIIGGEAVIYYGNPRLTGDIDFYYRPADTNIHALHNVLLKFWNNNIPGSIGPNDLKEPGFVIQFGVPPNRIDLLNGIGDLNFDEVWNEKKVETIPVDDTLISVNFIGLQHLILTKEMAGRNKDLDDLKYLRTIKNDKL